MGKKTHFGYKEVDIGKKQGLVNDVFNKVASRYDTMNDVLSVGMHRLWKQYAVLSSGLQPGDNVLDVASGSGDMAMKFANCVGKKGQVIANDINGKMLLFAKQKIINKGYHQVQFVQGNAEELCFVDDYFHCVCIAFGLRNMPNKEKALKEAYRVLKKGGRLLVLEFSKVKSELLGQAYDFYSFNIMPKLGKLIANDEDSYRYLVESIRQHPNQEELKSMFYDAGFELCDYENIINGLVALHRGVKT